MLESVSAFDWDSGNRDKCTDHGVSLDEIEFVLRGDLRGFPDVAHSAAETRFLAIGRNSAGRYVFIAFTLRRRDAGQLVRPISARYMHQDEVRHYEAQSQVAPQVADDVV
jgi:uncharacterized DUF497 family protein